MTVLERIEILEGPFASAHLGAQHEAPRWRKMMMNIVTIDIDSPPDPDHKAYEQAVQAVALIRDLELRVGAMRGMIAAKVDREIRLSDLMIADNAFERSGLEVREQSMYHDCVARGIVPVLREW